LAAANLVSIVIANYNYARFLGAAITSALEQTHPALEVVVVDDGSTDDSREVAARYPVRLVTQRNLGVSAARNRGARETRGKYLVFLDSDDILEPTYVAKCLAALTAARPEVAYAYTHVRHFGGENFVWKSQPFDARELLERNYVHAASMVRRDPFLAVGGFNTGWNLGLEDYELWLRMLEQGYTGVLVPEPLLRYRRHGPSMLRTLTRRDKEELGWRVYVSFPRLFMRRLARRPLLAAYWFWRNRRISRSAPPNPLS